MGIRRRTKRVDDVAVPTASMSDIAFLLIIFFILTSVFTKDTQAKLEKPESEDIQKLEEVPEVIIAIDEDGAVWYRNDKLDNPDMLQDRLETTMANVQGEQRRALLYIHKESTDRKLWEEVMESMSKAGVKIVPGADQDKAGGG